MYRIFELNLWASQSVKVYQILNKDFIQLVLGFGEENITENFAIIATHSAKCICHLQNAR